MNSIGSSSLGSSFIDSPPKRAVNLEETSFVSSKMHEKKKLTTSLTLVGNENKDSSLPLRVEPGEIRFESVTPGTLYVMTFSIYNCTKTGQRIRLEQPKSNVFALNYIPVGSINPGLDLRAEVECQLPEKSDHHFFKDSIIAVMGSYKVEIPLYASRPCPDIKFQSFINLGLVVEGQSTSKILQFENIGDVSGQVTLSSNDKSTPLTIIPMTFEIPAKGKGKNKESVDIKFDGKTLGAFRELLTLTVAGNYEPMTLDINAQVVQHKVALLSEKTGGELLEADFGTLFFGRSKTIRGILVNNGPGISNFNVTYAEEIDQNTKDGIQATLSLASSEEVDPMSDRPIVLAPLEGCLKAYAKTPITITFTPKYPAPTNGFKKTFQTDYNEPKHFTGCAVIENPDVNQTITLLVRGSAVLPNIVVSPMILRFGNCAVYDRRDILVTVTNTCTVAVDFNFSKIAHFKVTPSSGLLQPKQALSAIVSFLPAQLGKFKNVLTLKAADGLRTFEVRVMGEAVEMGKGKTFLKGGKDALPEDFKPAFKFIEPGTITAARGGDAYKSTSKLQFSRSQPWADNEFESSTSWDENASLTGEQTVHADQFTYSLQQLERIAMHKEQYTQLVRKSHADRQTAKTKKLNALLRAKGIPDRSDPDGPDLGLERGIEPPELKIPKAGEPLWLERRMGDEAGGRGRRIPVDENRLIVRKYPEQPATQAELRDISKVLTPEEVRQVIPSHKVLNFGSVNVTSLTGKNFVITNDLEFPVIIRISDLCQELRQSRPNAQIIPPGALAGFDIYFTSRDVGKFKKFIHWSVNGQPPQKLIIAADVIPIELTLDKKIVRMTFPEDSLERSISQQISLINPGNAAAEFTWNTEGAFECFPSHGTLDPNKSIMVTVVWTPTPSQVNEDQVGLSVVGGQDQFLSVIGSLRECKAYFEEKKLTIGVLAVGQERKLIARIKNSGQHAAVFHFDDAPENLGMTITPKCGYIPTSEFFDIDILIKPKSAMSYENVSLTCAVRGGKSLKLGFSGEAKIADITLVEQAFRLGPVVVGSEYRVPLTLMNNSNFSATLTLDLTNSLDLRPCLIQTTTTKNVTSLSDDLGNILEHIPLSQGSVSSRQTGIGEDSGKEHSGMWKLHILPNCALNAALVFIPTVPKHHSFRLPLYVKVPGELTFARPVTADGLQSRLQVSSFIVDFGDRVVSRDPGSRMTYYKEVVFTNVDRSSKLSFEIKERENESVAASSTSRASSVDSDTSTTPVFFISPMRGDLLTGDTIPVRVTFLPQGHGDYFKNIDVYITGQPDTSRPYFTLLCRGSGVFPRLSFSKYRLTLPSVPLGITSRASFSIINNGYDNLELKYRISPTIPLPLNITFPDGSDVGLTREKATIVVAAKSDIPVSWTGKIEFYDTDGEKFSIELCGCSDNCLFTVYPFVKTYKDRYGFIGLDDQPISFISKKEIAAIRLQESRRKEAQRRQRAQERQLQSRRTTSDALVTKSGSLSSDVSVASKVEEDAMSVDDLLLFDGVDLHREHPPIMVDDEVIFLLKWLNKFVCRKPIDVDRFPDCVVDTKGDIVIECIELMSGKKIQGIHDNNLIAGGRSVRPSTTDTKSSGANEAPNASALRLQAVERLVTKYRAMMSFLTRAGALLTHINPLSLLGEEDYLLALEAELRRRESDRLTVAMVAERRETGSAEWLQGCCSAWGDILYQAVKVFTLSRVTYKEYKNVPGTTLQDRDEDGCSSKKANDKKKGEHIPKEFTPSNIYGQAEAILLHWASYHARKAGTLEDAGAATDGMTHTSNVYQIEKKLMDLDEDAKNFFCFLQVIHSHAPESAKTGGPLVGYTVENISTDQYFARLSTALTQFRLDFGVTQTEAESSGRTLLLFLLHLFLNIPSLVPKTTIEFKGILGTSIPKTIELKNPSSKKVGYRVTLEGSQDFTLQYDSLVIEPETAVDFAVACNARFSKPAHARLTFWGIRDRGVGGSNMVFRLVSNIIDRKPVEIIKRTVTLFELETIHVTVTNPSANDVTYPVALQHSSIKQSTVAALGGIAVTKTPKNQNPVDQKSTKVTSESLALLLGEAVAQTSGVGDKAAEEKRDDDEEYRRALEEPIWCMEQSIRLAGNGTGVLTFNVLPFTMGKYVTQIVLLEENNGEFCYQIEVEVILPKLTEKIEFSVPVVGDGGSVQRAMRLETKNILFEKAVTTLIDMRWINPAKKLRAKTILNSHLGLQVPNEDNPTVPFIVEIQSPYFNTQREFGFVTDYLQIGTMGSNTGRSGTFNLLSKLKINKNLIEDVTDVQATASSWNALVFSFFPQNAGTYKSRVAIYGKDNDKDIRMFELVATVLPPVVNTSFEFRGPARTAITQEIPIINESKSNWVLSSHITGKGFSGPSKITVPAGEKVNYPVSFIGPYSNNTFDGVLVLKETTTGDSTEYKLVGIAEEPLAEGHFNFKCLARSKEFFSIPLNLIPVPKKSTITSSFTKDGFASRDGRHTPEEGISRRSSAIVATNSGNIPGHKLSSAHIASSAPTTQIFSVETDLPYVSGEAEVEVGVQGGLYTFQVMCPIGGIMSGSMTFKEIETGLLVWYTIDIEVTAPQAESLIEVEATVRKAVAVEIGIDNPTDGELEFNVQIQGEGLLGDRLYVLPARGAGGPYELIFSPLVAGNFNGRISFTNDVVGEFWYALKLTAIPAPPTTVEVIECMLGQTKAQQVPIENPLAQPVTLSVRVSDPDHFSVVPDGPISLDPYSQTTFDLVFRPSSLTEIAYTTVTLIHPLFGELVYAASGKGSLPGMMPSGQVYTGVGDIGSHTVMFRNPFPFPLPIDIVLTEHDILPSTTDKLDSSRSGFSTGAQSENSTSTLKRTFGLLLRKSTGVVMAKQTTMQIGVSFSPEKLGTYNCMVQVRSSLNGRNLLWCFPVCGIAEAGIPLHLPKLITKCKTSMIKEVTVPLNGLRHGDLIPGEVLSVADFSMEMIIDKEIKSIVTRAFKIQPLELISLHSGDSSNNRSNSNATADYSIRYRLLFEPLKVFNTSVQIMILCKNKGRWRAEIDLEATTPDSDDLIYLSAAVGEYDRVSFNLSNRFLGYSNFQAYFSTGSSGHFSVLPTSGVLAPYGSEGTKFVVSFSPFNYGGKERATLLIVTDEAQWTYDIEGSYPDRSATSLKVKGKMNSKTY